MAVRGLLGALVVPAVVLVGTVVFFASVREAPSVTQRVPFGVMAFILVMTAVVVVRAVVDARSGLPTERAPPIPFAERAMVWGPRIGLVLLGVAYYLLFERIGFSLANFAFLSAALPLAGFGRGASFPRAAIAITSVAAVATVVFAILATVMQFNVPVGPFGF